MKNNRRNFLKLTGLAGIGVAGGGIFNGFAGEKSDKANYKNSYGSGRNQRYNMCGYAAPKLNTVRVGFIGLGQRGPSHMTNMDKLEGVEIKALCDVRSEMVEKAKVRLKGNHKPVLYSGKKEEWKKLCDQNDIDLVFIATPWDQHAAQAVYAMEQGKHVAIEVPAAVTVEECWQLVETSERTKKHCMMLENCCYDFFEMLTLNMARQGFFGEVVHTEGAYLHDLLSLNFKKDGYYDMWRLKENMNRNGNLYPTHGLGPVCQVMNINRGDQLDYLVAVSSNDFSMSQYAKLMAADDAFYKPFVKDSYRGNMNTTTIRTKNGGTIMLQHDVSSPHVYSRIHKIVGTKGSALKYPEPARIAAGESWVSSEEYKALETKYTPAIVKKVGEMAKKVGGHGGMDFIMDWRLIDCLRNGLPLDQDVYDAALWSAIAPLSEKSLSKRSNSIDIPDFTAGTWKTNKPLDLTMSAGGNTEIRI